MLGFLAFSSFPQLLAFGFLSTLLFLANTVHLIPAATLLPVFNDAPNWM